MTLSRLQRQALQRYAVAVVAREQARAAVRVAEREMVDAQREANRHGSLTLPVTAALLDGRYVTLDHASAVKDPAALLTYTIAPALLEDDA